MPGDENGLTFQDISQTTKLGVQNPICNEAAKANGPRGQWGAIPISYVSAIVAIFFVSEIPPEWAISG